MEQGYYHPERGYWQTTCEPAADLLASYPAGTIQVPLKPGPGYTWDGVQWQPTAAEEPAQPTRAQLVAEIDARRDAALAAGVMHDGVLYHADTTFLLEMLAMLQGYQLGLLSGTQAVRSKSGTTLHLTAAQITAVAAAVGAQRQAVYAQSWAEKDALP